MDPSRLDGCIVGAPLQRGGRADDRRRRAVKIARKDARGSFKRSATRSSLSASTVLNVAEEVVGEWVIPKFIGGMVRIDLPHDGELDGLRVEGRPIVEGDALRSVNVYWSPSFEMTHDSARPGISCVLSSGKATSVSTTRRPTRFEFASVTWAGRG